MGEILPYVISGMVGIGLAAASGFRVFLPMFLVSLNAYFGWFPVGQGFEWLATTPALIATGMATVAEILAYYIPVVDNFLDTLAVPLATVAGAVLFAAQFGGLEGFPQWALALIAGGGTAAAVSAGMAGTRAASTATTGGVGNPVVSTVETAGAGILSVLALFLPILAGILGIALVIGLLIFGKKIWRRLFRPKTV